MIKLEFPQKTIALILAMTLSTGVIKAQEVFEFDDEILEALGFDSVDLSAFAGSNGNNGSNAAGKYIIQLEVNNRLVAREQLASFFQKEGVSQLCVTHELATKIPLRYSHIKTLRAASNDYNNEDQACLDIQSLDPDVEVYFDSAEQVVQIAMPQAFIEDRDASWIAPELRDNGIAGAMLDYSLIWNFQRDKQYDGGKRSSTDTRSYGTVGANIGRFRLRADYQYSSGDDGNFEWSQIYGYTDIPEWNAKLQVGELSMHSNVFETVRIKGASLYSDENMMPLYLRGYAPQITGLATTNSIVTISQQGMVLKRVQVPVGPFVISDLPSYISGTVSVEVEGSDGSIDSYQVDIAQVPFLTRKGDVRYNVNIGKIDPMYKSFNKVDSKIFSGDLSYGLTNNVSLFGGAQYTTNNEYKAFNIGLGINLEQFGAISIDITKSKSHIEGQEKRTGESYRFNYSKQFSSSTSLNIAGYRFSSRDFTSLNNYVDLKQNIDGFSRFEKNRFSLTVSQYFSDWGVSVVGSLTKGTYWNEGSMSNYNISLNKTLTKEGYFQGTSLSLSLSQNKEFDGYRSKQVALYVSIPIDPARRGNLQYGVRYDDGSKRTNQSIRYNAEALGGYYSVGAYFDHKRDLSGSIDYALTGYFDKETGYGRLNTSVDYDDNRESIRAGFDGSLTLTKHGLATHSRVYGNNSARLILDAGAPGVESLDGYDRSNIFGLMGVSNVSTYRSNSYEINNDILPEDVEITKGVVQVSLSDGAIGYSTLGGISGAKSISTIMLSDGSYPPFGATVYRENGEDTEVAIVAEKGLTYLTGIQKNSTFSVKWGSSTSCQFKIQSLDIQDLQNLTCY